MWVQCVQASERSMMLCDVLLEIDLLNLLYGNGGGVANIVENIQ